MSISKVKDDFTAEECVMVCPALTPVFPPPHTPHTHTSVWYSVALKSGKCESEGGNEVIIDGPLGAVQPCDECVFQKSKSPKVSKTTTLYALTGQLVAGEQEQLGPFFMVRNVNKNIAWDRVIKADAWGGHPITGLQLSPSEAGHRLWEYGHSKESVISVHFLMAFQFRF